MISTVSLSFDLTYTNPVTGALQPRGIVTDSTDYAGLGIDLLIAEAKGLGVITFNGDIIVDLNNPAIPAETMIDLQNWGTLNPGVTPVFYFPLELDLNGNVANGVYAFTYSLRLSGTNYQFLLITPPDTILTDGSVWLSDFLEIGNTIILEGAVDESVIVSSLTNDDPNVIITTSTVISGALFNSFGFDIINIQLNAVYPYAGCTQVNADVSFIYDCEVGDNGIWSVANTTHLGSNEIVASLNCTISYPSWATLSPTFPGNVVVTSLPYPSAPGVETPLATGTYTVSLTQQIQQTQTSGLIVLYTRSVVKEFQVSCAGTLCGLIPCIENLRAAHQTELLRNRISKYQVFVDNVLMYYIEALNYRACGELDKYRDAIACIQAQLDSSGCECACCDDETYYWVSNNSGVSVIEGLIQAFQFRLYNGIPGIDQDETQGVEVGALWQDFNTSILYICTVNTAGAAVWVEYYAPGTLPIAADIPAVPSATFLTANNVQGQLDQVEALAVFDGINGLNKVGNDVRLGGSLDSATTIDVTLGPLTLLGSGLALNIETINGPASRMIVEQASTTTAPGNLLIETITTGGAGANGIGSAIWLRAQDALGATSTISKVIGTWVNATIGSSNLQFTTKLGGTESVGLTLNPNSSLTLNDYGQGNNTGTPEYLLGVDLNGLVVESLSSIFTMAVGRITQTGIGVPTLVQSIYNNTGGTFAFGRQAVGNYTVTLTGATISDTKSSVLITNGSAGARIGFVYAVVEAGFFIRITTYDIAGVLSDDVLTRANIEIKLF